MLVAGFSPSSGYTVVEWLAKISDTAPDQTVTALELFLRNPHTDRWSYTPHKSAIRAVLTNALTSGSPECADKAAATIGYLASIGEGEYVSLIRPGPAAGENRIEP